MDNMQLKISKKSIFKTATISLAMFTFFLFKFDMGIIAVYIYFIWLLFLGKRNLFVKYLYLLIFTAWNIVSVAAIDNFGISVTNLQINHAKHIGALPLLVLANMIFWFTIVSLENKHTNKIIGGIKLRQNILFMRVIVGCLIVVLLLFLLDISKNNFFSSGAATRYEFVNDSSKISLSLYGWIIYLIPVASIYSIQKENEKIIYVVSGLYFTYLVLSGTKFGAFIQLFYIVIVSYFFCRSIMRNKKINKKKLAFILIGAFGVLIGYSLIHYYIKFGNITSALLELNNRLFNGQGDVWWGVFRSCSKEGFHSSEIFDELTAFTNNSGNQYTYNFGIYKMMKVIAPDVIVRRYAEQNIRFTMSTDASLYYYFGPIILLLIKPFFALLTYKIVNGFVNSILSNHSISSILYCYLLIQLHLLLLMSDFAIFFRWTSLVAMVSLFIIHYYRWKI